MVLSFYFFLRRIGWPWRSGRRTKRGSSVCWSWSRAKRSPSPQSPKPPANSPCEAQGAVPWSPAVRNEARSHKTFYISNFTFFNYIFSLFFFLTFLFISISGFSWSHCFSYHQFSKEPACVVAMFELSLRTLSWNCCVWSARSDKMEKTRHGDADWNTVNELQSIHGNPLMGNR